MLTRSPQQRERHLLRYYPIFLTAMLALGLQLVGEPAFGALRYERYRILSGELWRAVSGHFVHTGWLHVSLNVLGLLIIGLAFPVSQGDRPIRYTINLFLLAVGISGALWYMSPAVHWYVGLSGLLHGLLVIALIEDWKQHRWLSMTVLAILGAKLTWEHASDVAPVTSDIIGAPVIGMAHVYGSLAGLLIAFGYSLGARWARRDEHRATVSEAGVSGWVRAPREREVPPCISQLRECPESH